MKKYRWQIMRKGNQQGLTHVGGEVEAHDARAARQLIADYLDDFAQTKLLSGDYTLLMTDLDSGRNLADRVLHFNLVTE